MEESSMNDEDSNMTENANIKDVNDEDAMDIDGREGSHELFSNSKNENQLYVAKNLETCIVIDGKRQKSKKRVRFVVDDNREYTNRSGKIDGSNSKHLNSINLSGIETMENIKFQSKLLDSNRCSDSYMNHIGYPSKLRYYSFNRLNTNECQQKKFECNVTKEYSFSKNTKYIQLEKENAIKVEGELSKATLHRDHSHHEDGSKYINAKNNKYFEVTDIVNSIAQNNNNSNNIHTNNGLNVTPPTSFECNGLGPRTFEDTHNTSLFDITMLKSNLDRFVRQYQMRQKNNLKMKN